MISTLPLAAAALSGVMVPLATSMLGSAPAARRDCTAARLPFDAASGNGVRSVLLRGL